MTIADKTVLVTGANRGIGQALSESPAMSAFTLQDGTARAGLWPKLVAESPDVGEYQTRTTRQIPVFMLTRQD